LKIVTHDLDKSHIMPFAKVSAFIEQPSPKRRVSWYSIACASVVGAAVLIHARYYWPFLSDDSLISLRYTKNLLAGHGLVWNVGERVEGYSNLLWMLIVAALGACGVDLIVAARILGLACTLLTALAIVWPISNADRRETTYRMGVGLLFAFCAPTAVWAIGGLEQPLLAVLLAWAYRLAGQELTAPVPLRRNVFLIGALLGGLCLTRPDGPIFTIALVGAIFHIRGISRSTLQLSVQLIVIPVATYAAQLGFRLIYYGEWVPNTALVKLAGTLERANEGIEYLVMAMRGAWPLIAVALVAVFVQRGERVARARIAILLWPIVLWSAYVVFIGGDVFPAYRHFIPIIVMLSLLAATGATPFTRLGPRGLALAIVAIAALAGTLLIFQSRDKNNVRARQERWEFDGQVVGTMLKRGFGASEPWLATSTAGCLPYWSELPAIDTLGLNDYYIARHPPAGYQQGPLGHNLGDGAYVLRRNPDLVMFCSWKYPPTYGGEPCFVGDKQLMDSPEFHDRYTLVSFVGDEPYTFMTRIWVLRDSERIGIRRKSQTVDVPAFLFNGHRGSVARLDQSNRFFVTVDRRTPAKLSEFMLPPGQWALTVDATGAPLRVRISQAGSATLTTNAATVVTVVPNIPLFIEVTSDNPSAQFRAMSFRRTDTQ
jgi:arabinofuranosyltransferase